VTALLSLSDLSVEVPHAARGQQPVQLVDGVAFDLHAGRTLGLVGESGSGKTLTALAILNLLPRPVRRIRGQVQFDGRDLTSLPPRTLRSLLGRDIGVVFQDPQASLDPSFTVGAQLVETIRTHTDLTGRRARDLAVTLLERVGISEPAKRLRAYPHQLSGGMAQRVMIALAVCCGPRLLVADEPTTALDVTVQAQILALLRSLQEESGMASLLISHDLGVVAEMADDVAVMQGGRLVEQGAVASIFHRPHQAYTKTLLAAHPAAPQPDQASPPAERSSRSGSHESATGAILVEARGLGMDYERRDGTWPWRRSTLTAVDDVDLVIHEGEAVGLVGESGAGKSTVGRLILGLELPTRGSVLVAGRDLARPVGRRRSERGGPRGERAVRRELRRDIQVVFQNPHSSLDPMMTVGATVAEPFEVHTAHSRGEVRARVADLLEQVGLAPALAERYPDELSGGQRQRIAIARALALQPRLIVCDEATSALDVSTQAQVIDLLAELKASLGVAYLFISHDLSVVYRLCERVAVMRGGQIVEVGPTEQVYHEPADPDTQELLDAVLSVDPGLRRGRGRADSQTGPLGRVATSTE
jgi:peptide/nickel transport system ATP-binding protein